MPGPRPRRLGDRIRHYWLAQRMGVATGVDLAAASETGDLTQEAWADAVQACRACGWTEGCDCWLAARQAGSAEVLQACPNAAMFRRLKGAD